MRETARERGRWRERVRKRKREFTAVYPYRSSLAALASPRQGWAESKTANWQQVQPTHAPTRREPDVRRAQKMQCIITKPTSIRSEDLAVSVAQNSECVGLGIPRWHCVQDAAGTGVCCSKRRIQAACSIKTHQPNRTLEKCPEQLPTGLSFCTKVDGFDPNKRVVGLKGSHRLQLPVQPPSPLGEHRHDNE